MFLFNQHPEQKNTTSVGDVPNVDLPNVDLPNGDVPNGDVPNGDVPNGDPLYPLSQILYSCKLSFEFRKIGQRVNLECKVLYSFPSFYPILIHCRRKVK